MILKFDDYEYDIKSFEYRITAFDADNSIRKFQKILDCSFVNPINIDDMGEIMFNHFNGNFIITADEELYTFNDFTFENVSFLKDENHKEYRITFIKSIDL